MGRDGKLVLKTLRINTEDLGDIVSTPAVLCTLVLQTVLSPAIARVVSSAKRSHAKTTQTST